MWNYLRIRIHLIACVSILNLLLGIHVITSVVFMYETQAQTINLPNFQSNMINASNPIRSSLTRKLKSEYDYYFRIDYTTIQGVCQPLKIFNTTETIRSIEKITNEIIDQILNNNIEINLQILKIHTKLKKSERVKQTASLIKSTKLVCSYIVESLVGIDFSLSCDDICRSTETRRMISNADQLDYSSLKFSIFKRNSIESSIEYSIENVLLYRTVKYLEEAVFIQSIAENRYISITILDSNANHTSVSMSKKDKSLFVIKNGLSSLDISSIYVSFVSSVLPNLYLRHENGRVKLANNDQSILFKEDATFKLIFHHEKNLVAFQIINLSENHFLTVDTETNTALVVMEREQEMTIDQFDKRFLFKIIK